MIFPIVAYGDPVLKKKAQRIESDHPGLDTLIAGMYETMYNAQGVGLAAPQIGRPIRLFVVDAAPFAEGEEEDAEALKAFKKTFINAEILEESGDPWSFTEGCLSIPEIREDVQRQAQIRIRYQDEEFETHEETYSGLIARVIQHEYDHIEGRLFTDKLSPLKKQLLKGRLNSIAKGKIRPDYPMKFPQAK
ncbi:MAG: peptide deformylase [Flavobacteriia bacterium]|nr:peptide deformylase [Flavobacteriia bacterium]